MVRPFCCCCRALAGQSRHAHITALRGNVVNPALLGMGKVASEDSVRRCLAPGTPGDGAAPPLALERLHDAQPDALPPKGLADGAHLRLAKPVRAPRQS